MLSYTHLFLALVVYLAACEALFARGRKGRSGMKWTGKALQALRKKRGLTQADVADAMKAAGRRKASPQNVSRWEKGSSPRGDDLVYLARALGVDVDAFYDAVL